MLKAYSKLRFSLKNDSVQSLIHSELVDHTESAEFRFYTHSRAITPSQVSHWRLSLLVTRHQYPVSSDSCYNSGRRPTHSTLHANFLRCQGAALRASFTPLAPTRSTTGKSVVRLGSLGPRFTPPTPVASRHNRKS